MGGLTTAARGAHVTAPGRAAWEAKLREEFGIPDDLPEPERQKRETAALRVRMARIARARWGTKKPDPVSETTGIGQGGRRAAGDPRQA